MKKNNKKNYQFGQNQKKANNTNLRKGYFIPEGYNMIQMKYEDADNIIPLNSKEECENFYKFTTSDFVKGLILHMFYEEGTTELDKIMSHLPWMDWSNEVTFEVLNKKIGISAGLYSKICWFGRCNTEHPLIQDWLKVFDKKNFFGPENN